MIEYPPPPPPPPGSFPYIIERPEKTPKRYVWVLLACGIVAVLAVAATTVYFVTRPKASSGTVAGELRNTYPTKPSAGWSIQAGDLEPGAVFTGGDFGRTGVGSSPGFAAIGDTIVTGIGDTEGGPASTLVAVDGTSGHVRWRVSLDGKVTCATSSLHGLLPCVSKDVIRFYRMADGAVDHSLAMEGVALVEVSDGALFTAKTIVNDNSALTTVSRGSDTNPSASWERTLTTDSRCVGDGDLTSLTVRDGLVSYSSAGTFVVSASDGKPVVEQWTNGVSARPGGVRVVTACQGRGEISAQVTGASGSPQFDVPGDYAVDRWLVPSDQEGPVLTSHGAYDPGDGHPLWQVHDVDLQRQIGDVVLGNQQHGTATVAYRIDTGAQLWQSDSTGVSRFQGLVSDGERIVADNADGNVVAVNLNTGSTDWTASAGGSGYQAIAPAGAGFSTINKDRLTYFAPTGGPSGPPGVLSRGVASASVTKCAKAPAMEPAEYHTDSTGLIVRMQLRAACQGGDIVSTDAMKVSISDSGGKIASGVFNFAAAPVFLPSSDSSSQRVERELKFPLGQFWRLPNTLGSSTGATSATAASNQNVDVNDEGTSHGPTSGVMPSDVSGGDAVIAAAAPAAPSDPEATAMDALRAQANADRPSVQSDLADHWAAEISAKQVGLDAADVDGTPMHWTAAEILRQHLRLRMQHPEVRLVASDDWATFDLKGWWVTIAGVTFNNPDDANGWCDSHQIAADQCFAKLVSNTRGPDGTTKYRPR
ncbi:PQQ-binding-like beta-propeller repeat protein [Skermania sp. ID1734]|uniref:outer membrane protein assembly factor BamB family protein n=1 Tax=Skermania sp. ID1734 TaxID=2597516 RepID=UPI0011801E1F|nr:PQQ-binding-like beta-propeller repeat protein [Skermania sp. ID1734]TSE00809.1 PQQ-binding-like beta-propeller repeat protein [Skermania sp. ID1734]